MSIVKKIKKHITYKVITQTQLAETTGIYQKNISDYEADLVTPSIVMVKKIAEALDLSLDYLLSDDAHIVKDKRITRASKEIDKMKDNEKKYILEVIEAFIRDYKLKNKGN